MKHPGMINKVYNVSDEILIGLKIILKELQKL